MVISLFMTMMCHANGATCHGWPRAALSPSARRRLVLKLPRVSPRRVLEERALCFDTDLKISRSREKKPGGNISFDFKNRFQTRFYFYPRLNVHLIFF
jgi:hypothetical protein